MKARLIKKNRRLRIEAIATLVFMISICAFAGAKFVLKSYNYGLARTSSEIESQANVLKEEVASLKSEISNLENRERVLGMAESDGIKPDQNNVTVIGEE